MRCLRKTRVVACRVSLSEFQALTVANRGGWRLWSRWGRGAGGAVHPPPHLRVSRELGPRRERTPQFAVVAVQIESRTERGEHELPELAKPIGEGPLVARERRVATSDRLEVLGAATGHIEHVRGWRPQLEGAAFVIVDV